MVVSIRGAVAVCLVVPLVVLGYSEAQFVEHSRRRTVRDTTVELEGQDGLALAADGGEVRILRGGGSWLCSHDPATGKSLDETRIRNGHNLQVTAMAAYQGALYVLSRTTNTIYRLDGDDLDDAPLLRISDVDTDLRVLPKAFAFDGTYVYLLASDGVHSLILRVHAETHDWRVFARIGGRAVGLSFSDGKLYYLRHLNRADSQPILCAYQTQGVDRVFYAPRGIEVFLPCGTTSAFAVLGERVVCLTDEGRKLVTVKVR